MATFFSNLQLCPSPTLEALRHESERNEKSSSSRDGSGGSVLQNCPFTGANESLLFSPPPEEKEKNESHLCATEYEHQLVPPECNGDKDHSFDRHGGFPDNPHLSEELGPNHAPTADLRTWQESTENKSEPNVDLGGVEQSLRPSSELLQESGTRSSPEKNDGFLVPATKSLLVPSPSGSRENEGASASPLAVTTHSAFNAAPQPEHLKNCLIDQHMGQQVAPTHCLHGLSQSGIHDLEKNTSVSSESVAGKDGDVFGSPDGAYDVGSVFQHSPSNTIAEMPKIICYPPLDGNELERSGLESWFGCGFMISQGISHSLGMPHPSVDGECDPHLYSTASQVYPSLPSPINDNKDHNPELLQSLRTHQLPTVQCDTAVAQSDKAKPPCINLQALLKRSQEYRRHQRMLRSKGKSCEVQKSGELTRAKTDEQSLPDNRSNELLHKSTEATNEGKHNEKESTFIPAEEIKHFWEKHKTTESQFLCNLTSSKSENAHVQEDGGNKEISTIPAETTIENDPVNVSQGVPVKPQQTSSSPHQHREGSRKYRMTRAATFSQSPVYWKSESTKSIRQSEASGLRKDADDNRFNKEQQVHEATFDHQAGSTPSLCTVNHMIVGEIPNHAPITSEHIDLIESSLCGLKAQILDLESTLINNLEDHSPTESDMHSDKQHVQLFQSDCAYLGDELSHSVTATDAKCLRRQLLKEMSSAEENPGPEPSNGHDDTLPIRREGPQVVTSGEHRLFQTLNTEETMLNLAYEEEPLPGKGVPHKAQQGQIPEAFQNISPETQVSSNFAHRSNRPEDENEATVGCQYCGQPSHLWLLQGSGSELGSKDHPRLENHLTPEKGGEFQGGVWRIKRRLLTRTKNETDRNSSDDGRGQGSALSGKTWTFTGQRCQKCGQKQCKYEVSCYFCVQGLIHIIKVEKNHQLKNQTLHTHRLGSRSRVEKL